MRVTEGKKHQRRGNEGKEGGIRQEGRRGNHESCLSSPRKREETGSYEAKGEVKRIRANTTDKKNHRKKKNIQKRVTRGE